MKFMSFNNKIFKIYFLSKVELHEDTIKIIMENVSYCFKIDNLCEAKVVFESLIDFLGNKNEHMWNLDQECVQAPRTVDLNNAFTHFS